MENAIQLKNTEPLAKGRSRLVFQHPDHEDHLIKVIRPDVIEERFGKGAKWYKRLRRFGRFLSYHREIEEYLAVYASHNRALPFLPEIIGFAETDLGLGLVIRAIKTPDGKLAPSLIDILSENRETPEIREALEKCFSEIVNCDVIISDLNVGNFVHLEHENRFVLIDGTGNASPLAFKAYSRALNRRHKLRRIEKFRARIERYRRQIRDAS